MKIDQYRALLDQVDALLRETYALWDPGWVTFNWRGYTYDHVQRVRGLAISLCEREGGDSRVAELAALLHDITKPYDGEYITDSKGKRITDERGYWRNAVRKPARTNSVTRLYDELGLAGRPHNESGALLSQHLLLARGVPEQLAQRVATTIRDHLLPSTDVPLESRCLYDADTIDANIGLPAFVRNIYINLHFYDKRRDPSTDSLQQILETNPPMAFLRPYVAENLPHWAAGKRRDFMPRLLTDAARELALDRLDRLDRTFVAMAKELDALDSNGYQTRLTLLLHYCYHRDDPSISIETAALAKRLGQGNATPQALQMLRELQMEIAGEL